MASAATQHTPIPKVVGLVLGLGVIVTLLLLAFTWPQVTSEVKDLPIAITGDSTQVEMVSQALGEKSPGTFDLVTADDKDEATALIENRTVYGAIVLGQTPEVLTSSAASTVTNQMLTGLAGQLQAMANQAVAAQGIVLPEPIVVTVTDVVPLSDDDPRGAGLAASAFPLLFGGMVGGIAISIVVVGAWRRIGALIGYGIVGGLVIVSILQGWFGALQGDFAVNTAAVTLSLLAIAAPMVGLSALIGRAGIAVGPVLFMLFANPISGAGAPMQFLPEPWGAVGQAFPPGAAATLLRSLSYFPEADTSYQWLVLSLWAGAGILLAIAGHFRTTIAEDDAPVGAQEVTAPVATLV